MPQSKTLDSIQLERFSPIQPGYSTVKWNCISGRCKLGRSIEGRTENGSLVGSIPPDTTWKNENGHKKDCKYPKGVLRSFFVPKHERSKYHE